MGGLRIENGELGGLRIGNGELEGVGRITITIRIKRPIRGQKSHLYHPTVISLISEISEISGKKIFISLFSLRSLPPSYESAENFTSVTNHGTVAGRYNDYCTLAPEDLNNETAACAEAAFIRPLHTDYEEMTNG